MKTIFLTGSNGFIGRHLLPLLSAYDVTCGGYNEVPDTIPDYIIHLAAVTTTSSCFLPEMYDTNIVYAHKIMSYPCRIIYASSTSAAELTNPYAYTKQYIEHLGSKHRNATGLRFFNIYGDGNNKGIVKRAIHCAQSGEKLQLSGGFQVRDFIHVVDVVAAIINSLDSKEKIIEVGTGSGMTINEAIRTIEYITGKDISVIKMPCVKTDMEHSVANLGISGCLSFEEGIRRML